jgi:hypothetical protein
MADPHALYVVTAVVVLGLIAWVGIVLARPAALSSTASEKTRQPPSAGAEGQASETKGNP